MTDSPASKPIATYVCAHDKAEKTCPNCQMLTFLCINEQPSHLPYMVADASRLIFKQLQLLYIKDEVKAAWERLLALHTKQITGGDPIYARPLLLTKKRYVNVPQHPF